MPEYHLAARIRQEQGAGKSASSTANGTYTGYKGYYNFFNYGAYDTGNAVTNGLIYAKNHGWSNQNIAIVNGAKLLANDYMLAGQNTAYFYKWDVVGEVILEKGNTVTIVFACIFALFLDTAFEIFGHDVGSIGFFHYIGDAYTIGHTSIGGGVFGSILGYPLTKLLGNPLSNITIIIK